MPQQLEEVVVKIHGAKHSQNQSHWFSVENPFDGISSPANPSLNQVV